MAHPGEGMRRGGSGRLPAVVIPIHDDNPVRRRAYVTYVLIALNVVVFLSEPVVSEIGVGGQTVAQVCEQQEYFDKYAAIPKELVHNEAQDPHIYRIREGGRDFDCLVDEGDKPPYLSVLFAMFLHGGWLHLLGNMLFLWVFGNNVEDRMGRLRFLLFYVFCGYVATYGFALGSPDSTTTLVGASGAIAGVLGAYLVMFPRARVTSLVPIFFILFPIRLPAWLVLGSWFVLQWLYSSGTAVADGAGVAYLAHVFGFLAGLLVALAARAAARPRGTAGAYDPG
jgi:membrane associated rhomboid family serine protease